VTQQGYVWRESTMSSEQVALRRKVLRSSYFQQLPLALRSRHGRRQLRMRMVTIEPGGVFGPIHDHKGRPGTVYILQGTTLTIEMESLRTMDRSGLARDRNTTTA